MPQQGRLAGAQRHRVFARHVVHDAEALDGLGDRLHSDDRGDPRGHRIQRLFERDTQRCRPAEPHLLAALRVIGRRPHRHPRALGERYRAVDDQCRWREAMIERGQIDERLDRGARLAFCLGRAVELARREAEPAADREDAPGVRIHGNKRARDLRHLAQGVEAGSLAAVRLGLRRVDRLDHHDIAGLDDIGGAARDRDQRCRCRGAAAPSAFRRTGCAHSRRWQSR